MTLTNMFLLHVAPEMHGALTHVSKGLSEFLLLFEQTMLKNWAVHPTEGRSRVLSPYQIGSSPTSHCPRGATKQKPVKTSAMH